MKKLCLTPARYLSLFITIVLLLSGANAHGESTTLQLDYSLNLTQNLTIAEGQVCGKDLKLDEFTLVPGMQWRVGRDVKNPLNKELICLHYKVRLNAQKEGRFFQSLPNHDLKLSSLNNLLPCPTGTKRSADRISKHVSFKLPTNKQVSIPGQPITGNRYLLASRPCGWSSGVLLGQLAKTTINASESNVHVAMPASLTGAQQNKIVQWLTGGINSLAQSYGVLPVTGFQILVFPTGPNIEAVPWGQVMRGGGDSVHLYIDETKTLKQLNDDWVLVHELSHLLHPYLNANDSWLAEGIASYYQNVLRARQGLLDPDQAWEKLHAGFQRGLRQVDSQMTLKDDTRRLLRERKYMRVYWGGAAIALLADVHLRTESSGEMSLDTVLKKISQCCLPTQGKRWRARALMQRFDDIADSTIFSSLYSKYVVGAEFPSLVEAYRAIGIQEVGSNLEFAAAPNALHRRIMTAPLQEKFPTK